MVEISRDARLVIEIEASRLRGYAERNTVKATMHVVVGRDPENPALDDGLIRRQKLGFEVVVNHPDRPGEWTREIVDALKQITSWIQQHEHLDVGAFEKCPQPIRLNRPSGEEGLGIFQDTAEGPIRYEPVAE
jgi:hypothetical protein